MATPSVHRLACDRCAIVVSALAAAAALTCAATASGVADATPSHAAAGRTYRVLSIGEVGHRSTVLQYITPHNRYRITRSSEGGKPYDAYWEKDVREGERRLVNRVLIYPQQKRWFEERKTFGPLPPHPFGIRSTTKQVRHAIQVGKARLGGLSTKNGQQVRELTLVTSNDHVKSDLLWVDPVTDRPVAERKTFLVGERPNPARTYTKVSHWENVSLQALNQLKTEPKVPAGYKIEH